MDDNNSHAKEVAEEEYHPERRQPLDAETLMSETLSTIIQSLPPVDKSIKANDREQTYFAQKMPIFHQKNELFVAYLELTEEEIVQLGNAIFDHPQIASVINHINFCGNQFSTERFILFCHLVIAPILYFSGTLALRSSFGFNVLQEVVKNNINEQQKLLISEIEYGAAFHQNSQTGQLPNVGYSSATAIRHASSGWGTNFGLTGIECDNNGASTDGWKVLVGMLCGDEDVIKEGEKVRKEYLCENKDQTKEGDCYTLIAAARRSLGPSATNLLDDALLPSISDCFSYHLSTLSHLEISENYIHDIGALYGSILLSMAPNLSNVSFVTNQLTSRAMKDFVKAFETRFDALEGISAASTVITAKEAEQLVQKSLQAGLTNHSDESSNLISSDELKNVLQSIVSATRLVEKESLSIGERTTTQISPSAYVEYPYCIPQHLVESGYPYSLKQLYLDYNSLGDDGVELLVKTIGYQCPSLVKLGLSDNRIGDKGATAIAKHIIANPVCRVQHLNLSVNIIGDEGFVAIAKALSCAYVEERNTETETLSSSYELRFKTPVRFDRPAAHYYDVDTEFFIDELEPNIPTGLGSKSHAINIKIIDDEKDGDDGLGEGDAYVDNLRFDQTSITLTRTQVDLLLNHTKNENNTMTNQNEEDDKSLQYTINTRLYHLDLANQNNKVQHEGRVAILSLAFAYKYLMSLDVTALDITNEEMRLLPRAIRLGSQIGKENNSKNESDASTTNLWHFTCGLVNCEWYNNPKIFPQTEELVGRTLETSIERCQIREEVVDKYLKKSNSNESENQEFNTFLGHLKRLCEEKLYVSKELPTQNVHVGKTAKIDSGQPSSSSFLALTITGLTLVGLAAVVYTKYIKGRRYLN